MDLQLLMNEKFEELETSGKLNEIVNEAVTKCVTKVVEDYFSSYGAFAEMLKKEIKAQVEIDVSRVNLPSYGVVVAGIVKERLENSIMESVTPQITTALDNTLGILEKKQWLLSEIIHKFTESIREDEEGEIALYVERSNWGSTYISFDNDSNTSRYNCEYSLSVNQKGGDIWNIEIKGKTPDITKDPLIGSFEQFLFKLYASKAVVIIDESEVQREYTRNDY